jgi:hypothetical protein
VGGVGVGVGAGQRVDVFHVAEGLFFLDDGAKVVFLLVGLVKERGKGEGGEAGVRKGKGGATQRVWLRRDVACIYPSK